MVTGAAFQSLAGQARRLYTEELVKGLAPLVQTICESAQRSLDKPAEPAAALRRRELVQSLLKAAAAWHRSMVVGLRDALQFGVSASRIGELPMPGSHMHTGMTLVDDDTIELEIMTSRLALAIMDRASWEFSDLRSRIAHLEHHAELEPQDLLRAHVLARIVVDAWRAAGLPQNGWREVQQIVHEEFAHLVEECLPRDQPLADRAPCAARGRPAAVDPAPAQPADPAHRLRRRLGHRLRRHLDARHGLTARRRA